MNGAECAVAGVHFVNHNAKGVNVHNFFKGLFLQPHFLIDAVKVFLASDHHRVNVFSLEADFDGALDLFDQFFAVAPRGGQCRLESARPQRVHGVKTAIFKFNSQVIHAQSVRNGGINFQCFFGDPSSFFRFECFQGAHVVQAVGQLHDDDANVLSHGQSHLLEVLSLFFGGGFKFELREFADAVHQFGNGLAKLVRQGALADTRIFNHIVQHGGHQALMIHVHVGQVLGHFQGVCDVGLATAAFLAVVGLFGVVIRSPNELYLRGFQIGGKPVTEYIYREQGLTSRSNLLGRRFLNHFFFVLRLFFFVEDAGVDEAFFNFAQGQNGGLVILGGHEWVFAANGQLTSAFAANHH